MNVYSRTLTLPGAVRPVREHGSSALDRAVTSWAAPDPAARVLDPWGAPTGPAIVSSDIGPWPAPDPAMRVDLAAPDLRTLAPIESPVADLEFVEPRHAVAMPDLRDAARNALVVSTHAGAYPPIWPAPTAADAVVVSTSVPDRSGISTRLVVGLAAAAGAIVAGAAAFVSLF